MNPEPVKLRKDSWPLCPKCGDDELASDIMNETKESWDHDEVMAGTFFCYACRWEGLIKLPVEHYHAE